MCILEPKKYGSPNNSVLVTEKYLRLCGSACFFLCKARKYLLLLPKNIKSVGRMIKCYLLSSIVTRILSSMGIFSHFCCTRSGLNSVNSTHLVLVRTHGLVVLRSDSKTFRLQPCTCQATTWPAAGWEIFCQHFALYAFCIKIICMEHDLVETLIVYTLCTLFIIQQGGQAKQKPEAAMNDAFQETFILFHFVHT